MEPSEKKQRQELFKRDDTISQISKVRRGANQVLINELNQLGLEEFVPSHGEIVLQLLINEQLTMTEIAQRINKDRSTVTALVNKLKKYDYLATQKSPDCGRTTIVYMTEKGRALESAFIAVSNKLNSIYQANISDDDLAVFHKVLTQIQHNFDQENGEISDQ